MDESIRQEGTAALPESPDSGSESRSSGENQPGLSPDPVREPADNFEEAVTEAFSLSPRDPSGYSPLVLAWIGDAVYEMMVRSVLAERTDEQVRKLHHEASQIVKAASQAAVLRAITPKLTPEERAVTRRGRNAKSYTMAKNATMSDYRHATALEALCGWLYLKGQNRRLVDLLRAGFERTGMLAPGDPENLAPAAPARMPEGEDETMEAAFRTPEDENSSFGA